MEINVIETDYIDILLNGLKKRGGNIYYSSNQIIKLLETIKEHSFTVNTAEYTEEDEDDE